MEKTRKKKLFAAIGLVLICSNLIIGHYAASSNLIDFIRGLVVGIGFAFLIFPYLKKRKAKAA